MRIEAPLERKVCQHTGRTYEEVLEENADLRATVEGLGLENAELLREGCER